MFITILKKTARVLIFFILVITVGMLFNSAINAWRLDYFLFAKEKKRVLSRAMDLSQNAEHYNEQLALAGLGQNKLNGHFYRLDDHFSSSQVHRISDKLSSKSCFTKIELNFRNPNLIPLSTGSERDEVSSGILHYTNSLESILTSVIPLEIHLEELGSVQFRMKLAKSKRLYFGWTSDVTATWKDSDRIHYIKIFTIPDKQFQDYSIDAAALLSAQKDSAEPIRKVFLAPESAEPVTIDYLKFDARMEKYFNKGSGVLYEKINNEMRKSLFVESGYEVDSPVDIPDGHPCFQFGVGAVNPSPVSFTLVLRMSDRDVVLLTESFSGPFAWKDYRLDLTSYSGKHGHLVLRSEGAIPNAVLISNPILLTPLRKPFNAMIVIEDSLRSDHLNCFGYSRETSPAKDQWAEKGVRFSKAFSQASFTRASCASFLTSLYPGATGVWSPFDVLDNKYTTLAEILRSQGFATLLISQIVNVSADSGLHQGFDSIIDFRTVGVRASGVYQGSELNQWIANHPDQNKFIYLHVFDPHHPYEPPEAFGAEYSGKPYIGGTHKLAHSRYFDPPWLKQPTVESRIFLYDEEIRYNDSVFDSLLETLKNNGIYEDTLVIFTADHGEFLGDHGLWGHMPPNFRQVLHVPMIMVYPAGLPKQKIIQKPVQLLDIAPTILDLASIPTHGLLLQGDSLLPLIRGDNPSFWKQRLCISDEVQNSRKNDKKAYQSIVYKNFHILTTNAINDHLREMMQNISPNMSKKFFQTRLFDMDIDFDERRAKANFFADIFFNFKIRQFANKFRKTNLDLWRNIIQNSQKTSTIDTEALEQLKSLGYVN